jgi:hypothetical protein
VDAEVVEAIVASLERHGRAAARAEADALLIARRGIRAAGTDLLDPPYYLWEPLERFYPDVMSFEGLPRPATLRSPWPETALCLICGGKDDVTLEITARLPLPPSPTPGEPFRPEDGNRPPAASPGGFEDPATRSRREPAAAQRHRTLRLFVNGSPAGTVPLRESWSRPLLRLPRHLLRPGRNRLTLHWPAPATPGGLALAAALARLDEGIAADLHPVFGELYSVVASPR